MPKRENVIVTRYAQNASRDLETAQQALAGARSELQQVQDKVDALAADVQELEALASIFRHAQTTGQDKL
jgi:hypothetical protein